MVRTHSSWMKWAFREKTTLCLILQSWVTSLSLRHWCRFWSFIFSCLLQILMLKTSSSFIFVAKNVLDCNLRLKGKSTNCTQCFHSTLRWKGKNQQNWKESSELKIAPKTKNQYSCRRGWDFLNLACGKLNLASNEENCSKMSFWVTYLLKEKSLFVTCMFVKKTLKKTCRKKNLKKNLS